MFRAIILFVGLSTASALSAESSGMPQLDPGVWVPQIFWLIITFGFLYVVIISHLIILLSYLTTFRTIQLRKSR